MPALAIVPSRMTRSMALNVETNVEALVSAVRAQATQAQLLRVYRVATLLELARCVAVMAADWTGTAARLLDKVSCKTAQEAELRVVEQLKHTLHNHRNHTGRLGRFLAEFWKQGKPDTMPTAVHAALWAWFEAPAHDDVLHGVSKTQALLQALRAELPQEAELCKQGVRLYSYNVLHKAQLFVEDKLPKPLADQPSPNSQSLLLLQQGNDPGDLLDLPPTPPKPDDSCTDEDDLDDDVDWGDSDDDAGGDELLRGGDDDAGKYTSISVASDLSRVLTTNAAELPAFPDKPQFAVPEHVKTGEAIRAIGKIDAADSTSHALVVLRSTHGRRSHAKRY